MFKGFGFLSCSVNILECFDTQNYLRHIEAMSDGDCCPICRSRNGSKHRGAGVLLFTEQGTWPDISLTRDIQSTSAGILFLIKLNCKS